MTALGHIYKIICTREPTFCYIGSTFNRLSKRFEIHRWCYTKWLENDRKGGCSCFPYYEKHGIENFKIVLIKSYEVCRAHVKDRRHLEAYETLWINRHKGKCVNQNMPIQFLRKERTKVYREKNKEVLAAQKKVYRETNKESIAAQKKVYRETNKESIAAKMKVYHQDNKETLATKKKVYREDNKESIAAKKKVYHEKNKESISEKKKEKVECPFCKNYIRKASLPRHQREAKYCIEIQNAN